MIGRRALLRAGAAALALPAAAGATGTPAPVDFVALGDMPYRPEALVGAAYRHLIDQINDLGLPFAIHVGDFKDGLADCGDGEYARQHAYFQRFASALVYTPGDNDWIDCQRRGADPLERLQALRARFFADERSLGQRPIALQRQGTLMPAYARYRENARWTHQGVVFATFHTVGPHNGLADPSAAVRDEARVREAANAAWIRAAFAAARESGARALVLATQAETLTYPDRLRPREGVVSEHFAASVRDTLLPLAEDAPCPVLLVHGDFHAFITDQPFRNRAGQRIARLWRLEVFGEPRLHAVRVRINAGAPAAADRPPFEFFPVWNPLSPDPRQHRALGSDER